MNSYKRREIYNDIFQKYYSSKGAFDKLLMLAEDIIDEIKINETELSSRDMLKILYTGTFSIGFWDSSIESNNEVFKKFKLKNSSENPLVISIDKIKQIRNNLNELNDVEIYAQGILISNRLAKLSNVGMEKIVDRLSITDNEKRVYGSQLWSLYNRLTREDCMESFITKYRQYNEGEIDKKDLEEDIVVKRYNKLIEIINSKKRIKLDLKSLYEYSAFEYAAESFYEIKNKYIKELIKSYAKDPSQVIINSLKDRSKDKSNIGLEISIPDYSAPFQAHFRRQFITDLEKENNIKINEIYNSEYPSTPILPIKLDKATIDLIKENGFEEETSFIKRIQTKQYILRNSGLRTTRRNINIRKPTEIENKRFNEKRTNEKSFAEEMTEKAKLYCDENYIEMIANNSQTFKLSSKYFQIKNYFIERWNNEGKQYSVEELEEETAKAFIYTKIGRGGIQDLNKNIESIYEEYMEGFEFVREAINNGETNVKKYIKAKMKRLQEEKTENQDDKDAVYNSVNGIYELRQAIDDKNAELQQIQEKENDTKEQVGELKSTTKDLVDNDSIKEIYRLLEKIEKLQEELNGLTTEKDKKKKELEELKKQLLDKKSETKKQIDEI